MSKPTFKGGVHPPEFKELSEKEKIESFPIPETVIIPLTQHLGAPSKPIVNVGDEVKTGDPLSEPQGFVSVPVHSSVTGKVKKIAEYPHPLGVSMTAVEIERSEEEVWNDTVKFNSDYMNKTNEEMINDIKNAGLAGMGGATFPTHVKLSPPKEKKMEIALLNGAECEPYLTSDHRLMLEYTEDIVNGFKIIMKILGVTTGIIGIENNKMDAVEAMQKAVKSEPGISVVALPVKYPQGGEKQLIEALTGRQVPSGGLPMDCGCLVSNVGTAKAVFDAVSSNKPLIERVVTVTGKSIKNRKNYLVRIGTSYNELLTACGLDEEFKGKLISGGPMMGIAQCSRDVPVIKGTSGIVVLDDNEVVTDEQLPCISCGRCVDICPIHLMPTELAVFSEFERFDEADKNNVLDCIECGSCSYICPSKRHLVQYIRYGKFKVMENRRKAANKN